MNKLIDVTLLRLHRPTGLCGLWECETVEPPEARAQVVSLFGTARIKTPYDAGLLGSYVQGKIAARNPGARVEIAAVTR